ncbi:MAG: LppX_LprAFG lipoprotein [Chloroflexota bacterium]|nr:LppX_LprAFG lipoprotein [Chloroflexota bacterium]
MTRMKNLLALMLMVCAATVALYACGGESPTATAIPATVTAVPPTAVPPSPTTAALPTTATGGSTSSATSGTTSSTGGGTLTGPAADLLNKAQVAMRDLKSYHLNMTIDSSGMTITADGDFMNPDTAHLSMDMGSLGKSDVIVIGKDTYAKIPGTDSYVASPSAGGANSISDPNQLTSLAKFANSASIIGDETIDGANTSHIKFSYNLDQAMSDTANAAGQATPASKLGNADGEIWVEKSTGYMRQLKLQTLSAADVTGTPGVPTTTNITVKYSKFNEDINPPIVKPTNITTVPSGLGGSTGSTPGATMPTAGTTTTP